MSASNPHLNHLHIGLDGKPLRPPHSFPRVDVAAAYQQRSDPAGDDARRRQQQERLQDRINAMFDRRAALLQPLEPDAAGVYRITTLED